MESSCLVALMAVTFSSLPVSLIYPVTAMVLVGPVISKTTKQLGGKHVSTLDQYLKGWCNFIMLCLCCLMPFVTSTLLFWANIMDIGSALSLAVCVPVLGICWIRYLGRLSESIALARNSRKLHLFYSLVRLCSVGVFISVFIYLDRLQYSSQTSHHRSKTKIQINVEFAGSALVLIISSCAYIFSAFISLSLCQATFGITFPSLVSTLVVAVTTVAFDSHRLLHYVSPGIVQFGGQEITSSTLVIGLTGLSTILVFILYSIGHGYLPGSPEYLMAPFDQLFNDYVWSSCLLDVRLILSAYIRGQTATVHQNEEEQPDDSENSEVFLEKTEQTLFVCATMFRESQLEMKTLLTSLLQLADASDTLFADLTVSIHIFFDDGCHGDTLTDPALQLLRCVLNMNNNMKSPVRIRHFFRCAYGVQYRQNICNNIQFVIHFKDIQKYKAKKRWSQAMYMQYIINYYLNNKNPTMMADSIESVNLLPYSPASDVTNNNSEEGKLLSDKDGDLGINHYKSHLVIESECTDMKNMFNNDPLNDECGCSMLDSDDEYSSVNTSSNCIGGNANADNTFVLVIDGDTEFSPLAVFEMLASCIGDGRVGAVCGRIHPKGEHTSTAVWYQKFEYAQDFWLLKSSQNVFGTVTCCPGCFSLYRVSAIVNILATVCEPSLTPVHIYRKDTGEDRWITAMIILQGWRLKYVSHASSVTFCPDTFSEFLRQRKRWILSDFANDLLLLRKIPELLRTNESITLSYAAYYYLLLGIKILFPGCIMFSMALAIDMMGQASFFTALFAILAGIGMYVIASLLTSDRTHARITMVYSVVLAALFLLTVVDLCVLMVTSMKEIGPTHASFYYSALLFLPLVTSIYGALLHPNEAATLRYWPVYMLYVPTIAILLPIYSICSIGDQRWGTRDGKAGEDKLCCRMTNWNCFKGGYSKVSVDDFRDREVAEEEDILENTGDDTVVPGPSNQEETIAIENMASVPGLANEAMFWDQLKVTLLGNDVNLCTEPDTLARDLLKAKYFSLAIFLVCNIVVLSFQCAVYKNVLGSFLPFDTYVMAVAGIVFLFSSIPVLGLTCHTLLTLIRRVARDTYASHLDGLPIWIPRRHDARIDSIIEPF